MEGDAGTDPVNVAEDEAQQTVDTQVADTEVVDTQVVEAPVVDTQVADAEDVDVQATDVQAADAPVADTAASRLGRGWLIGVCAVLVLLSVGLLAGGYLGWRYQAMSRATAAANAAALAAAKECVLATQAPDSSNVQAAQQKIFDCTAGEFRTQATLYSEMFVHAYQAAKVHVELTEMAAAVERDNLDGSIDVLVAFRVKVDNIESRGREVGYRLRAQMIDEDGEYRIGRLDQVAR